MVFLSKIVASAKKGFRPGTFKDALRMYVRGGHGGSGLPQYGGIGGSGGNVYLVGNPDQTLMRLASSLRYHKYQAGSGVDSSRKGIVGKRGLDLSISIPCGVTIYTDDKIKLGEVNEPKSQVLVAKGGLGGCPETDFFGQKGQHLAINLDLKLIADVGLVGFPNAGKSTLLKGISRAKPKIADYPFTTIRPQLGTITYQDYRKITIADLPGLIEGAHVNHGMGHKFLKHVERTKLLLLVIDIQGFQLSYKYPYRNCLETLLLLNREIELYDPDLLNMSTILILNKMDTPNAHQIYQEIKEKINNLQDTMLDHPEEMRSTKALQFEHIILTSLISQNKEEILDLKTKIRQSLDDYERAKEMLVNKSLPEQELIDKLNRRSKQHAVTLI